MAAACGLVPQSLCTLTGTLAGGPGSLSPILEHLELPESRDRAVITRIRHRLRWREKCLLYALIVGWHFPSFQKCDIWFITIQFSFFFLLFSLHFNFFFLLTFDTDFLNAGPVGRNEEEDGELDFFVQYIISYSVNGTDIKAQMWDNAIKHKSLCCTPAKWQVHCLDILAPK